MPPAPPPPTCLLPGLLERVEMAQEREKLPECLWLEQSRGGGKGVLGPSEAALPLGGWVKYHCPGERRDPCAEILGDPRPPPALLSSSLTFPHILPCSPPLLGSISQTSSILKFLPSPGWKHCHDCGGGTCLGLGEFLDTAFGWEFWEALWVGGSLGRDPSLAALWVEGGRTCGERKQV